MPEPRRPRRGRPARVDRARIVAAARTMNPETLTMQAVAEELGVDRKTLNYHVSDREGLLELVALDVLSTQVGTPPAAPPGDWRRSLRDFATTIHDGMAGMGALFEYVRMPLTAGLQPLETGERILSTLVGAGFSPDDAARAVTLVTQIVYTSARDAILTAGHGGVHPQVQAMRTVLAEEPGAYMHLLTGDQLSGTRTQLAFDLDIVIAGLEKRLEQAE
ncbi:TetR/AcrR family transcriptional regulator [Actinoplanes rectilineatus]|uniref:TetR/AcrR family transcriptional regulator n=1 Tax=Actinoplanes rectilineatus TaxID=113571 RepID=UPI0005F28B15|nr:TetR/AcrR family transcriptional regulator C-terminal domain-containing protein [Actinoplanes rectilineatus]